MEEDQNVFKEKKKKPNAFVQSKTKPFHISAFFVKLHSIYSELYNFQLVGIKLKSMIFHAYYRPFN